MSLLLIKSNEFLFNFNFFYRGNLTARIVLSILVEVLIFVVTVALAMTDSSEWPGIFFWATIALVVILNSKFFLYLLYFCILN